MIKSNNFIHNVFIQPAAVIEVETVKYYIFSVMIICECAYIEVYDRNYNTYNGLYVSDVLSSIVEAPNHNVVVLVASNVLVTRKCIKNLWR